MDEKLRIEGLNRRIDEILSGEAERSSDMLEEDSQALQLARRLAELNPSRQSHNRWVIRRELLRQASLSHQSIRSPIALLDPAIASLLCLVLVFGLFFSSLGSSLTAGERSGNADSATPAAAIYFSGEAAGELATAAMLPEPVPTPLAPVEVMNPMHTTSSPQAGLPSKTPRGSSVLTPKITP